MGPPAKATQLFPRKIPPEEKYGVGLLPLGLAFWVAVPFLVALQGL